MSFFKKDSSKKKAFEERKTFLLTEETPFDIREGFRNFKASLSVSMPKKANDEGVAILITSSCPREGKTTLAVNLAVTYAISNAKVVIIDADIRKGRVARYFSEKSKKGLSDCLSGQATLEEVTHVSKTNEKLSYITCGTHSPRPYELLESEEMKKLLSAGKSGDLFVALSYAIQIRKTYSLLGLFQQDAEKYLDKYAEKGEEIPQEVKAVAEERWQARLNKDWAKSDELRTKLAEMGYAVKDSKTGYELSKNA